MPQVAERRNGSSVANRVGKAVDKSTGPGNGSPKNGFHKPFARSADRPAPSPKQRSAQSAPQSGKPDPEILFQKYFKSVGPRTYAAQLKRATNGNQFLVLTEGKRDDKTGDVRKTKLFIWSEDFVAFFRMLHETAKYIRENPLPNEIRQKRERYWAKQATENARQAPAAKPRFDKR